MFPTLDPDLGSGRWNVCMLAYTKLLVSRLSWVWTALNARSVMYVLSLCGRLTTDEFVSVNCRMMQGNILTEKGKRKLYGKDLGREGEVKTV